MSRISQLILAAAIALLALGLCAAAPQCASNRVVTVSEKDGKVRLTVGDTLAVRLQSTPSTGYGWQTAAYDKKLLKQMGASVMEDSNTKLLGAPQHQVFRFKALAAGTTALELRYVRSWEKGKPPARVFKISVRITKAPKTHRQ